MATITNTNNGVDLAGVANLANLFLGKTTNTSGSTVNSGGVTTQEAVSPDAVNAVVNSILQGSSGLAAVASGQNRSGLYNSTTNQMLVNDLLARTAAEGAKLNKTTTTTDSRATTTNNSSVTNPPISGAGAAKGVSLLTGLSALSRTDTGKKIQEMIFGKTALAGGAKAAPGGAGDTSLDVPSVTKSGAGYNLDTTNSSLPFTSNIATPASASAQSIGITPTSASSAGPSIGADVGDVGNVGDLASNFSTDSVGGFDASGLSSDFNGGATDAAGNAIIPDTSGDWMPTDIDYSSIGGSDIGDLFNFAEGGLVTSKGNKTLIDKSRSGGKTFVSPMNAKPSYADGGLVDLANMGLQIKGGSNESPLGVASNDQSVSGTPAKASSASASSASSNVRYGTPAAKPSQDYRDTGESSATSGTTSGQTGTPGQNAAAVAGMGIAALGLANPALGLVASLAAPAMGIQTSSMNPIAQIAQLAMSAINGPGINTGAVADSIGGHIADSMSMVADAVASAASTGISDDGSDGSGIGTGDSGIGGIGIGGSAADNGSDGSGIGAGDSGVSGIGVGDSSGNSSGGDSGDGGTSGDSYKSGGKVRGPGTSTSDSIDAKLSDGEYVMKADVVKALGPEFFDRLNSLFQTQPTQSTAPAGGQ